MRTAILSLTILASFALACPALAIQDSMPPASWQKEGPEAHAEKVMNGLVNGGHEKAFKLLFSRGRYPQATLEKIQFDYYQMVKKQGNPAAYEKIFEQKAGSSIVRLKYILLFKSQPMMFDLYYYSTGKDWLLKTFTISRDIKKIFER